MLKQIKDLGIEKIIPDNSDLIPIQQADGISRRIRRDNFLSGLAISYPEDFTHFHDQSIVLAGQPLAYSISTNYAFNSISFQNPSALNDSFAFKKLLSAGTYTLKMLATLGTSYATLSLKINNVVQFNDLVLYASSTTFNNVLTKPITIPTSGIQEFVFTVSGKHASSSNYFASISKFWGYK